MHPVIISFISGLCLCLAAGVTILKTAFIRITPDDLGSVDQKTNSMFYKMIRQQDRVVSALATGYMLLVFIAVTLTAYLVTPGVSVLGLTAYCAGAFIFTVLMTYMLPRLYALKLDRMTLLGLGSWTWAASIFFLPVSAGLSWLAGQGTQLFKKHFSHREYIFSNNDLTGFFDRVQQAHGQQKFLQQNLERFVALNVQDVMTPLVGVDMINGDLPVEEWIEKLLASPQQRLIVYQERPENIIGILHVHLMLKAIALAEGDKNAVDISSAISEPVFVSPFTAVIGQISHFRQHGQHFALVRDRNAEVKGVIALETMLENLAASLCDQ